MGAPLGNQNARKGKWSEAVEAAAEIEDAPTRRRRMVCIAEKLVEKAMGGDMAAIKEFGDRIDGRAHQSLDATLDASLTINVVRFADDSTTG